MTVLSARFTCNYSATWICVRRSHCLDTWNKNEKKITENGGRKNVYAPLVNTSRSSVKYRNIAKLKYWSNPVAQEGGWEWRWRSNGPITLPTIAHPTALSSNEARQIPIEKKPYVFVLSLVLKFLQRFNSQQHTRNLVFIHREIKIASSKTKIILQTI